jgi:RNA polymerase-binding transcription factor DksA
VLTFFSYYIIIHYSFKKIKKRNIKEGKKMPLKEKTEEYIKRLENELKLINIWLEQHSEVMSGEQLAEFEKGQAEPVKQEYMAKYKKKVERKKDIEDAIERGKVGTLGICMEEKCGREIEPERIEGDLVRKRCAKCQIEHMVLLKNGNGNNKGGVH